VRPQQLAVGNCPVSRKLMFRSFAKAHHASILIRSRSDERKENRTYLCSDCGHYHTTSKPRRSA
jgi:rubrerythrin